MESAGWEAERPKSGKPEQETGCGEAAKAREKGVYYLQFSSKTEEEMRRKLAEQGFSPASVDSAVKFLKERRYLNDEDYARRYLEKNGKKKSRKQLQYELSRKGISREILELVFEEMPGDEREQILEILRKRQFPLDGGEPEEKKTIARIWQGEATPGTTFMPPSIIMHGKKQFDGKILDIMHKTV